jgi:hypothetical protein
VKFGGLERTPVRPMSALERRQSPHERLAPTAFLYFRHSNAELDAAFVLDSGIRGRSGSAAKERLQKLVEAAIQLTE